MSEIETRFLEELIDAVKEYHKRNSVILKLQRPDDVVDRFKVRTQAYADHGVKPAKLMLRKDNRVNKFFKWASRDHHVLELLEMIDKVGPVMTARELWKHALKHNQI